MEYDFKDLKKDEWMYYPVWTVPEHHPKWAPVDAITNAVPNAH